MKRTKRGVDATEPSTSNNFLLLKIKIHHDCPLSKFMSDHLNAFCENPANSRITVVNFTSKKTVNLVDERPDHLKQEFLDKYGEVTEYVERMIYVIQRTLETDVIFFSMIVHEYENHAGVKYLLLDTLDSIPFFEPPKKRSRSATHREILLSYFAYMRKFGFQKAHFWANAPDKRTDMIFTEHPWEQIYLSQKDLERWYRKMLKKGFKDGIFGRWTDFRGFKREVEKELHKMIGKRTKIEPIHIPIFFGSLWEWYNQNYNDKEGDKEYGLEVNHLRNFRAQYPANLANNFWMDLAPLSEPMAPMTKKYSHEALGDKESFLELCVKNKWNFTSYERAEQATAGIIEEINRNSVVNE